MKKIIPFLLLIHGGLVVRAGEPCLPKKSDRTKDQFIKEVNAKPQLRAVYDQKFSNLFYNLGEAPESFETVVLSSFVVDKTWLNKEGIYTIHNGWYSPEHKQFFFKENDSLKNEYKYLYYRGYVIGALNCGNPVRIDRIQSKAIVDTIRRTFVFIDTIKKQIVSVEEGKKIVSVKPCNYDDGFDQVLSNWNAYRSAGNCQPAFTAIPVSGCNDCNQMYKPDYSCECCCHQKNPCDGCNCNCYQGRGNRVNVSIMVDLGILVQRFFMIPPNYAYYYDPTIRNSGSPVGGKPSGGGPVGGQGSGNPGTVYGPRGGRPSGG